MRTSCLVRPAIVALLALACGRGAAAIELGLPLDCRPHETCWIMNYVDRDPGPGRLDYACGAMTYDGHKGIDFGVRDLAAMRGGITVRAAAAGRVKAIRDGMADVLATAPGAPVIEGKECGNGVVIDHGDGWETQYCHMRKGSIAVRPGQPVAAGAALGEVGLSGQTEFPHLHLSVRHDGAVVDPFLPAEAAGCGVAQGALWASRVQDELKYQGGEVYIAGILAGEVTAEAMRDGLVRQRGAPPSTPFVTVYMDVIGLAEGDRLALAMIGPDGVAVTRRSVRIDRTQSRRPFFARLERPESGWPPGQYRIEVTYSRERGGPDQVIRLPWAFD